MNTIATFLIAFLLITTASLTVGAARSKPGGQQVGGGGDQSNGAGMGGFFSPSGGINIPGFGQVGGGNGFGAGYGAGFGGPKGGYSRHGVVRSSVVCKDKTSPCYKKKLVCPAKCFTSYSSSGPNYGGGGGGGCTIDCKDKCVAYC